MLEELMRRWVFGLSAMSVIAPSGFAAIAIFESAVLLGLVALLWIVAAGFAGYYLLFGPFPSSEEDDRLRWSRNYVLLRTGLCMCVAIFGSYAIYEPASPYIAGIALLGGALAIGYDLFINPRGGPQSGS